ncbi:MAG: ribosome-binding factor A [Magnetococcus sp. XQGC-1]
MNHLPAKGAASGGRVRTERVRGFIRQEIADMLLRQEIRDPRLSGLVSITDVEVSRDLQHATVYFSVVERDLSVLSPAPLPSPEGGEKGKAAVEGALIRECQQALTHAAGFIRTQLGRRMRLRYTPHLRFLPDNSLDYGMRMNRLLDQLHIPPAEDLPPHPSSAEER